MDLKTSLFKLIVVLNSIAILLLAIRVNQIFDILAQLSVIADQFGELFRLIIKRLDLVCEDFDCSQQSLTSFSVLLQQAQFIQKI